MCKYNILRNSHTEIKYIGKNKCGGWWDKINQETMSLNETLEDMDLID